MSLIPYALAAIAVILHIALFTGVAVRVIMLRPAPGVALAWLLLVAVLPLPGLPMYLLFGERRIGQKRGQRMARHR